MHFFDLSSIHHPRVMLPTVDNCDMAEAECKAAYRSLTELNYCPESHRNDTQRPCEYMDHLSAAVNTGDDNVMLSTRVHMIWQKHHESCMPTVQNGYSCEKTFSTDKDMDFYVADVENFWIILNHAVASNEHGQEVSIIEAEGTLHYKNGTVKLMPGIEEKCRQTWWKFRPIPCQRLEVINQDEGFTDKIGDHLKLKTILSAAGTDLDKVSKRTNKTHRDEGVALRVDIEYYNTRKFNILQQDQRIAYRYNIAVDPMTNFEIDEIRPSTSLKGALSEERLQVRKHGVYLRISVSGKFGYFSLHAVLLQIAARMVLLVLCDQLVRWLATQSFFVGEERANECKDKLYGEVVGQEIDDQEFGVLGRWEKSLFRRLGREEGEEVREFLRGIT